MAPILASRREVHRRPSQKGRGRGRHYLSYLFIYLFFNKIGGGRGLAHGSVTKKQNKKWLALGLVMGLELGL
jgi:hypothetical protein